MNIDTATDGPVPGAVIDEWIFTAWTPDGNAGVISGHRLLGRNAWYWSAHVRAGYPLLHLSEWEVRVRPDPMVVKAPEMWAEHSCDSPLRQWTIGNEAYFAALDDPSDALGRAYGIPTPTAFDLEWYGIEDPTPMAMPGTIAPRTPERGATKCDDEGLAIPPVEVAFTQVGVVHGVVEVLTRPNLVFEEAPAARWRRSTRSTSLPPVQLDTVMAHGGLRAPFRFPDGALSDWVVGPAGWKSLSGLGPTSEPH